MAKTHKILACLPLDLYDKVHARARFEYLSDSAFLVKLAGQYLKHNPAPPELSLPKTPEVTNWWDEVKLQPVEFRDPPILQGPKLNLENPDLAPKAFKRFLPPH